MLQYISNRGMAQLVARLSGGQEAMGSSPVTPTNVKCNGFVSIAFFVVLNIILGMWSTIIVSLIEGGLRMFR